MTLHPLHAGINPISGLPNYNGTYWGTPNTGGDCDALLQDCDESSSRQTFSTLYRDNYDPASSGCEGEGCGKHPGIDIAVATGTKVLAALGGVVEESKCSTTWGGLVVVRVANPYDPSETVRVTYGHLSSRSVYVGNQISQGQTIGYSGGDPADNCPGNSTGSHLHFQVDREHGGTYPWFPTGRVNIADDDFEVTTKTYHPLHFVGGYAYNFNFSSDGFKEYWGASYVDSYDTDAGSLWVDSSYTNPYVGRSSYFGDANCGRSAPCSREIALEADLYTRIVLNIDFRCTNGPVAIFYRRPDNLWHIAYFAYTQPGNYAIDLSSLTYWNGLIKDVIIRPSEGCMASPGPEDYFFKQVYFLPPK